MAVLTREQILARKVAGRTEVVDLGDGAEVVVRGLSRGEATMLAEPPYEGNAAETEIMALHLGIVEPAMSVDDVRAWRDNDVSGAIHEVAAVIQRMSGSAPGQAKDATKSVPRRRSGRR